MSASNIEHNSEYLAPVIAEQAQTIAALRQQLHDMTQETIRLRQIICDAVSHGVYEQHAKYWNAMVEVWRAEGAA